MRITDKERSTALALASRADRGGAVCSLSAGGHALTADRRDALLAKAVAGEYVELEADVLAFEQAPGSKNRNFVRFRDGAMMALGRSGKGNPFLSDHDQGDVHKRAGTVLASATEKRGDGDYAIRQTVKLTAPWAVELALRGLLDSVSIGWNPTGPVECSACGTEILASCFHFPGDRLSLDDNGKKKRDAAGDIVVEWVFTEAELVETSIVSVPAVPTASMEGFRAALSAQRTGNRSPEQEDMTINPKLLTVLGLAATAGESELLSAVEHLSQRAATSDAELKIVRGELAIAKTDLDKIAGEQRKTAQDSFITAALASGKIAPADEALWRELHSSSPTRATELMAARPANATTPVGAPRQSSAVPPEAASSSADEKARAALASHNVNPDAAIDYARKFGAKDPAKAVRLAVVGKDA